MHEGAALGAGEDRPIYRFRISGLRHDHPAPRPAEGLVGGGGHHVGIGHRRRVHAACNQPRYVRHIHHQHSIHTAGHLAEGLPIDDSAIGAGAGHDQLGTKVLCLTADGVVVQHLGLTAHAVVSERVKLAGKAESGAMGEMPTLRQIHGEHPVTRLQQRGVGRQVGLRTRVRLHIYVLGPEQRLRPQDCQILDLVNHLAATVVALPGVSLSVLVSQMVFPGCAAHLHRARHRREHGLTGVVLGRY